MSDAAELAALRAEISALRDAIQPRRHSGRDRRRYVHCAVTPDEHAAIHAEAAKRSLCVADLIRLALEPVLSREMPRNRVIPVNLQTGQRVRNEQALREQMRQGIIARRQLRDTGAAVSQTASVPVPKLRGPQRPE